MIQGSVGNIRIYTNFKICQMQKTEIKNNDTHKRQSYDTRDYVIQRSSGNWMRQSLLTTILDINIYYLSQRKYFVMSIVAHHHIYHFTCFISNGPFGLRGREGEQSRVEQIQYKISLFLSYTTLLPSTPPPSPLHPNRP